MPRGVEIRQPECGKDTEIIDLLGSVFDGGIKDVNGDIIDLEQLFVGTIPITENRELFVMAPKELIENHTITAYKHSEYAHLFFKIKQPHPDIKPGNAHTVTVRIPPGSRPLTKVNCWRGSEVDSHSLWVSILTDAGLYELSNALAIEDGKIRTGDEYGRAAIKELGVFLGCTGHIVERSSPVIGFVITEN